MNSRSSLLGALLPFSLLFVIACQKQQETAAPAQPAQSQPAQSAPSQPAQTPAPSGAAPASTGNVIASAQYSADPDIRCDLLEVKRVSGGALLIRWRLTNTASAQQGLAASQPKRSRYDFHWDELYYTDPAENKKYAFLTDSDGNRILDVFWGELEAGQQRLNWAKFAAPPPASTKVTVYIPKFMPFEDIPVAQ